jgi:WG containing repeat
MKYYKIIFLLLLLTSSNKGNAQEYRSSILIPYRDGQKWGWCDTAGKIRIQPAYDAVSFFDGDGRASVMLNKQQSIVDATGRQIIPFYDAIKPYGRYSLAVISKGKYGLYYKGKLTIPLQYDKFVFDSDDIYFAGYLEEPTTIIAQKDGKHFMVDCITGKATEVIYGGQVEAPASAEASRMWKHRHVRKPGSTACQKPPLPLQCRPQRHHPLK